MPKAGSTSIQYDLKNKYVQDSLLQDGFITIPNFHKPTRQFYLTDTKEKSGNAGGVQELEFNPQFNKFVEEQKGLPILPNLFGSSEYLLKPTPSECNLWNQTFMNTDKKSWNVQIVVVYRRLHDSLPSSWNQIHKYSRDSHGMPINLGHWNWPGIQGDIRIPSMEEWVMSHNAKYLKEGKRKVMQSFLAWEKCSNGFHVLSLHHLDTIGRNGVNDLTATMVCQTMKESHACNQLRMEEGESKDEHLDDSKIRRRMYNANTSINLNHDILAVYAYENHFLIPDKKSQDKGGKSYKEPSRNDVVNAIGKYVEKNDIQYPMKCPSESFQDQLYHASLKAEELYYSLHARNGDYDEGMPNVTSLTKIRLIEFDTDWNKFIDEKKFCIVDAEKVMTDENWQKFFKGLIQV